ncbi:hypothetical protein TWF506_007329 [Arthrobotrys conoides]|uniref:Nephrocystin 3-like N-terminal domain-containing protein n=1 Tax=Arthrobotrys conoides TaxID=74498 RepID=A0AAN8N727_9PEZI
MADPLSTIASIIAIIQGINGCWKVYSGIKDAKGDIERLSVEVNDINELLERVRALIHNPKYYGLSEDKKLASALEDCQVELNQLQSKLRPQKENRFRGFFRHSKWPFAKIGVVETVNNLERRKSSIGIVLSIYQTDTIRGVNQKIDFAGLLIAETAAYGSFADRHEPECLPGTRIELRKRIAEWADAPRSSGECIFWLSGVAGTGKSTISRTIARELRGKGQLAASFFFRRGEKDRGGAARLFTTLASQIANTRSDVRRNIQKAIEVDPGISNMGPGEQFSKLILQPLRSLENTGRQSQHSKVVIVIDALDECDEEKDQQLIISLLSQLKEVKQIDVRIFLTSRPELPIRLGFKDLSKGIHRNVILHEVSGTDRDIGILLNDEFSKIRKVRCLPSDWPGQDVIQKLVEIAVPLFIFAATACRFIADENWDPQEQVKLVMEYQTELSGDVEKTYTPVLRRLIENQNSVTLKSKLESEFRLIVGAIVNLASPLSIPSLAQLLSVSEGTIDLRLKKLHSVLNIPADANRHQPVRTFHLSFRDFLVSQRLHEHADLSHLWIDVKKTHSMLATRCIELMSNTGGLGLKQDICCLELPGILRSEIDENTIQKVISPELQYACRNWVYHQIHSDEGICDNDRVHEFLERRLLHWLEAESLLGDIENTIQMVNDLKAIANAEKGKKTLALLHDIKRFLLRNQYIIEKAPLQIYVSAIMFIPEESLVRKLFGPENMIPWVCQYPRVQKTWGALLQTLEGHPTKVLAVAFFDGIIASSDYDGTIKLWNANTGAPLRTIGGHTGTDWANDLAFSQNGILASASYDKTIKMWDTDTGELIRTVRGHTGSVNAVAFASNSAEILASGSDDTTVRLWDMDGTLRRKLEGHTNSVRAIVFSDGILASGSWDTTIRLWDVDGLLLHVLAGHTSWVTAIAFSPSGTLVSGSCDSTVRLWDTDGTLLGTLEGHDGTVWCVESFKEIVISAAEDNTINLWDSNGQLLRTLEGNGGIVTTTALASGGVLVAGYDDKTIRLWDLNELPLQTLDKHTESVRAVTFSSDGEILASASFDGKVKLWSKEGRLLRTITAHTRQIWDIAFSSNGILASASRDSTIKLWDTGGAPLRTLNGQAHRDINLTFSFNGNILAFSPRDAQGTAVFWKLNGEPLQYLQGDSWAATTLIAFSPSGKVLASYVPDNSFTIRLWDIDTGALLQRLVGHITRVKILAFSSDDKLLVSASHDDRGIPGAIKLWDAETWELLDTYTDLTKLLNFLSDADTIKLWDPRILTRLRSFASREFSDKSPSRMNGSHNGTRQLLGKVEREYVMMESEWLSRGRNRIWLPPDYRPHRLEYGDWCWDAYGNRIALGHASGQVSLIEFKS